MFYELDALETITKCPQCLNRYILPRILPCGKSICQNCVENLILKSETKDAVSKSEQISISCTMCFKEHSVPSDGFILNEFIQTTLQLQPKKVFRCQSFESLDKLLDEIQKNLSDIESKLNSPSHKIREHCEKIRNQIDITTEMLIEKLNKYRHDLLAEVNIYEDTCLKQFKQKENNDLSYFFVELNLHKTKLNEFYSFVNKSRIDETQTKSYIHKAKLQEYKLKNLHRILDNRLFGNELLLFNEMISKIKCGKSILGKFIYENLRLSNDLLDVDKFDLIETQNSTNEEENAEEANIKSQSIVINGTRIDSALELTENKYLVQSENYLKIFDTSNAENTDATIIIEIKFDFTPKYFNHNGCDLIFVQYNRSIWLNSRKEKCTFFTLGIYDFNLNLKNDLTLDYSSVLACLTNANNVFVQLEKTFTINVYSWSLDKLTTIGQCVNIDRPFYLKNYQLKLCKNDRIYLKKLPESHVYETTLTSTRQSFHGSIYEDLNKSTLSLVNNNDEESNSQLRVVSFSSGDLLGEISLNFKTSSAYDYFYVDALARLVFVDTLFGYVKIYENPSECINNINNTKIKTSTPTHPNLIIEKKFKSFNNTSLTCLRLTNDGIAYLIREKKFIHKFTFSNQS